MGLFKRGKGPSLGLLDTSGYEKAYGDIAEQGGAGDYGDVESFYTPDMQQAVLDEMTRVAQEGGERAQASISGAAVRSGFGVGNTSREMARRANAESDMLNEIVMGHINNAQNIQMQREQQAQEYAKNKFEAEQTVAGNKQSQDLAKLGYQEQLSQQQAGFKEDAYADKMNLIGGAIGGIGQVAGDYVGGLSKKSPTGAYAPSLGLIGGSNAAYNAAYPKKKMPWEN